MIRRISCLKEVDYVPVEDDELLYTALIELARRYGVDNTGVMTVHSDYIEDDDDMYGGIVKEVGYDYTEFHALFKIERNSDVDNITSLTGDYPHLTQVDVDTEMKDSSILYLDECKIIQPMSRFYLNLPTETIHVQLSESLSEIPQKLRGFTQCENWVHGLDLTMSISDSDTVFMREDEFESIRNDIVTIKGDEYVPVEFECIDGDLFIDNTKYSNEKLVTSIMDNKILPPYSYNQ
jgi:hypothetical protein